MEEYAEQEIQETQEVQEEQEVQEDQAQEETVQTGSEEKETQEQEETKAETETEAEEETETKAEEETEEEETVVSYLSSDELESILSGYNATAVSLSEGSNEYQSAVVGYLDSLYSLEQEHVAVDICLTFGVFFLLGVIVARTLWDRMRG